MIKYIENLKIRKGNRVSQIKSKGKNRRLNISSVISSIFIFLGSVVLIYSFMYGKKIPALIGLGLTFWGSLFLFLKTTQYVKKELLDAEIIPSLKIIDNLITELGYKGKGIYVSPRTLKELTSTILFIPYSNDLVVPSPEELSEDKVFHENPKGICITPPGLNLASIIEKKLGVSLFTIDFNQLQTKLNDIITRDLEIAQEFKMETNDPMIHVRIEKHIFNEICSDVKKLETIYSNIGCPLSSSIACILTKVLGKPIIIARIDSSENEKTIDIFYLLLKEEGTAISSIITSELFQRIVRE